LSAAGNALEGALPPSLSACPHLALLSVPGNRLSALLPGNAPLSPALVTLDARDNRLACLPCLSNPSPALATLLLGGNPLAIPPGDATLRRAAWRLATLDLSRCGLQALPEALHFCCPTLATLDVSNNDLNNLPAWLGWAGSLRALILDGNPMRALGKRSLLQTPRLRCRQGAGPPRQGACPPRSHCRQRGFPGGCRCRSGTPRS